MIAIGITGGAIIGLSLAAQKGFIYVDAKTVQLITYVGLGGSSLYILYEFGKDFGLF